MPVSARSVGIVLAAGASRRMGTAKAGLRLDGRTFLEHAFEALAGGGVDRLLVVTGADPASVIAALPRGRDVAVVHNVAPERGQLSSLKVALEHVAATWPEAVIVVVELVDHPAVRPATVRALLDTAHARPACPIVVPVHGGKRGHPVVFARDVWDELRATEDDLGARAVVRADPSRVALLEVDDPGVLIDVDTPADLRRLLGGPRGG
jgi:CTP:molybdopterin cytidylyltransferase MocA